MLDNILKKREITFVCELVVFAAVATSFLLASKHFNLSVDMILLLGFILGIGTEKLTKWLDKKHEELNS
jgi:hypothetical protein